MFPYSMLALQLYDERVREADRYWRTLAELGIADSAAPRRGPSRRLGAGRLLAWLRRRAVPRPA